MVGPPPGLRLEEHRREESLSSNYISYRAKRADRPLIIRVDDAPADVANRIRSGFCEVVKKTWAIGCMAPPTDGQRLWASELFVELHDVAGSVIVDLIGEALVNEGWETADLRIRFGVEGEPAKGVDTETALGWALGRRWVQALDAYLKGLPPPSLAHDVNLVRWVAAPGYLREDLWPLDYGMSVLNAGRSWTFQRSKSSGMRVGYLLDGAGQVIRSEAFETTEAEAKHAGWTTAADPKRRVLMMALPMTPKDIEALGDKANDRSTKSMFAVVALTRSGEGRLVGRTSGIPLSAPLIASNDDALVLAAQGPAVVLCRFNGMKTAVSCNRTPLVADSNNPAQYLLRPWGPTPSGNKQVAIVATNPAVAFLAEWKTPEAPPTFKNLLASARPRAQETLPRTSPPASTKASTRRRSLVHGDRAWILTGNGLALVGTDGERRTLPVANDTDSVMTAEGTVVAAGSKQAQVFNSAGKLLATIPGRVSGWAKAPTSAHAAAYVACMKPGLVAFDTSFKPIKMLPMRDICDSIETVDNELMVARFLWVARVAAPNTWPKYE